MISCAIAEIWSSKLKYAMQKKTYGNVLKLFSIFSTNVYNFHLKSSAIIYNVHRHNPQIFYCRTLLDFKP